MGLCQVFSTHPSLFEPLIQVNFHYFCLNASFEAITSRTLDAGLFLEADLFHFEMVCVSLAFQGLK